MSTILVIDDDTRVSDAIRRLLKRAGYDVVQATDGGEGLEHYRNTTIDLVITDLFMPGMEGMETIRYFVTSFPEAKVIAISGAGAGVFDPLDVAVQLGAKRALTKANLVHELIPAVAEVLGESSSENA